MPWPLSQDYNEAVQEPRLCFADDELRAGQVVTNALGLPMPRSGNFADVYEMRSAGGERRWAVKCFTRAVPGLRERYAAISDHLRQARLRFAVEFQYLEQGIRIAAQWYPVLKMDWVDGLLLNEFVRNSLDRPTRLDALAGLWAKLAGKLRSAGIAHGDLQHGNVLLVPGRDERHLAIKLIDYDGMYVPALARNPSGELGHPAYQHPQRLREATYNAEVDRFPFIVIYTAIRALMVGGQSLWDRFDNGDNLLFTRQDFEAPTKSALFAQLLRTDDPVVRSLAEQLIDAARSRLEQSPRLDDFLSGKAAGPVRGADICPPPSIAAPAVLPLNLAPAGAAAVAACPPIATPPTEDEAVASLKPGRMVATGGRRVLILGAGLTAGIIGVMLVAGILFLVTMRLRFPSEEHNATAQGPPAPVTPAVMASEPKEQKKAAAIVEPETKSKPATSIEPEPTGATPSAEKSKVKLGAKQGADNSKAKPAAPPDTAIKSGPAEPLRRTLNNSIGMKFVEILPGTFLMGSPESELVRESQEHQHTVKLTQGFFMGVFEVTQEQYLKVMGKKPGTRFSGADLPAEPVSWDEAQLFCNNLSALPDEQKARRAYRLPTEAEWEYCCRAGTTTAFHYGSSLSTLQARMNGRFPYNASKTPYVDSPKKVGSYQPNAWGLYDMHGNVWEWCEDYYNPNYYKTCPLEDPKNTQPSKERVLRGGAWNWSGTSCRSACRAHYPPGSAHVGAGLRVVCAVISAPDLAKQR
jgi:formylglycine-generating enzyme required for sulfatase activity